MQTDMTLFEDYPIRRVYDEEAEIWWFSVIDIIQVLTQIAILQMKLLIEDNAIVKLERANKP